MYQVKEITKKVYNNIMNLIQKDNEYYIYEFWNSKTFDLHRLLLNLTDKINLRKKDKYIALSNLSVYYLLYIEEY